MKKYLFPASVLLALGIVLIIFPPKKHPFTDAKDRALIAQQLHDAPPNSTVIWNLHQFQVASTGKVCGRTGNQITITIWKDRDCDAPIAKYEGTATAPELVERYDIVAVLPPEQHRDFRLASFPWFGNDTKK